MTTERLSKVRLARMSLVRLLMAMALFLLFFFGFAGTLAYWEAWVYMAVLFIPIFCVVFYLLRYSPELLERRMRFKEREAGQSLLIKLSYIPFLFVFVLPGLDRRFEWSHVPTWLVIVADILVLVGYVIVFLVFRENRYASRVVEVEQGQQVISSGPYAVVRHPMYTGILTLYIATPVALGSYWAVIPALFLVPVLVFRVREEEKTLVRELAGYQEYQQKVRYRLVPGVW